MTDELKAQIQFMIDNPGVYMGGDVNFPDVVVPVVSNGGKLWSMKPDEVLDPERFTDTFTIEGPYPMRMRKNDGN